MICSLTELRSKDVINIVNGENLGLADDISIDTKTSAVTGIILYGRPCIWGIFGKRQRLCISSSQIKLIGKDVILVSLENNADMCRVHNKMR